MHEIELRFQLPSDRRRSLLRWLEQAGPLHSERLQAAYFDTPTRDLARAGFALRLRREGRRWVQTVKGEAPDGMTRPEHNVALGQGAALPALDVTRHAGHPAGDALLATVDAIGGVAALQCLFRTDIRRCSVLLTREGSEFELALDEGLLQAGPDGARREVPVQELEIELKSGSPAALLRLARECVANQGLWLELRSKALRGDLLARDQTFAPPALAAASAWSRRSSAAAALGELLRAALAPILGNASQIASGSHTPEHLHQLRVGLLRLSVGLQLLQGLPAHTDWPQHRLRALQAAAQALRRSLSAGRDADALADAPWQRQLDTAWRATGWQDETPVAPRDIPPSTLTDRLRSADAQSMMLELLELLARSAGVAAPSPHDAAALRRACKARLARWQAKLQDADKRLAGLSAADRHRVRQRLRRLRYGLELTALLLPSAGADQRLRALKALQQQLGELNDLAQAVQRLRQQAVEQRQLRAAFALGYLQQEHEQRLDRADKAWRRWRKLGRR